MNMIFHAADDERLATKIHQNTTEVAVQFFAESLVAEKRVTILGGENRMHENLCKGLCHGGDVAPEGQRIQPLSGLIPGETAYPG